MSVQDGFKIPTNGLVLNVNAANSYTLRAGSTTWFDESGYNNHVTLVSSPTYLTSSLGGLGSLTGGRWAFVDNTNWASSIPVGTSEKTIIIGFRTPSSFDGNYNHILHYGTTAGDQAYGLDIMGVNFTGTGYPALGVHTWGGGVYGTKALTATTDYIGAVRYKDSNSPRNSFFLNGEFLGIGYGQGKTSDYTMNTAAVYSPHIGSRIAGPSEQLGANGIIYFVMMYNRSLSNDELTQVWASMKNRFGI